MFHCGDDLVGADPELQTDAAGNLMAHRPSPSALLTKRHQVYAHDLIDCH